MADPAKAPKTTVEEKRRLQKESCRNAPCYRVTQRGKFPCTFCPHERAWLESRKGKEK